MKVEVVYALAEQQFLRVVELPEGAAVIDAVSQSGLVSQCDLGDLASLSLGVFSRQVTPDTVLREGDRVEIYRPLMIDPMVKRRMRAKK